MLGLQHSLINLKNNWRLRSVIAIMSAVVILVGAGGAIAPQILALHPKFGVRQKFVTVIMIYDHSSIEGLYSRS